MKNWKLMIGILVSLLIGPLTGCRWAAESVPPDQESDDSAIVILDPDDLTVVNQITDAEDIVTYCDVISDVSDWQMVNSLPQDAEKLYVILFYEKKKDLSLFGNSGKYWIVTTQETLYRQEDTYYLEMGRITDGKTGITLDANLYYQLPDSVGEYYEILAEEGTGDIIIGSSSAQDWDTLIEDRIDEEIDAFDAFIEDEVVTWIENKVDRDWDVLIEDRIDRQMNRFIDRTTNIVELGVGTLVVLILGILWIPIVVLYILGAVGLYRMAKKTGYGSPWLAWIPIANLYLLFILPGGSFRVLALNTIIEKRESAFWIFFGIGMARKFLQSLLSIPGGRLFFLFDDAIDIAWLVCLIFFLYPLYKDVFCLFETEKRARAFAIWSLILPFLLPIFLLIAASKEPVKKVALIIDQSTEPSGVTTTA